MDNKTKALELIEKADWETLLQMFGFLIEEDDLRALVRHRVEMKIHCEKHKVYPDAKKEVDDFIVFFGDKER